MPIYEYKCTKCHIRVEILQAHYRDDKIIDNCPQCKKCKAPTVRLFSVPLVQYSGDGFFTTDSKVKGSTSDKHSNDSESLVE